MSWALIEGYGGRYQVNRDGLVRTVATGYVRAGSISHDGYRTLQLFHGGRRHGVKAHRLVALAYIPNPLGKPCINHLDHDRAHNRDFNLDWATVGENNAHCRAAGRGGKNPKARAVIARKGDCFLMYPSVKAASRVPQFNRNGIYNALNRAWQHGGFSWSYA